MTDIVADYIFLVGLILAEVIRAPHRQRQKREWRQRKFVVSRVTRGGLALDMLGFISCNGARYRETPSGHGVQHLALRAGNPRTLHAATWGY